MTSGIWLNSDLEDDLQLRPQIEAILLGKQKRLDLPSGFPDCDLPSLDTARKYPLARAIVISGSDKRALVNCAVAIVHVDEQALIRLGRQLDAIRVESSILPVTSDPRIVYRIRDLFLTQELWLRPGPIHRRRAEVLQFIRGERSDL